MQLTNLDKSTNNLLAKSNEINLTHIIKNDHEPKNSKETYEIKIPFMNGGNNKKSIEANEIIHLETKFKSSDELLENELEKPAQTAPPAPQASKRARTSSYAFRIIKLIFSNMGLVLLVFVYSTAGALMFQMLEQHEELRMCEEGEVKVMKELKNLKEKILDYKTEFLRNHSNESLNFYLPPSDNSHQLSTNNFSFKFNSFDHLNSVNNDGLNLTNDEIELHKNHTIYKWLEEFVGDVLDISKSTHFDGRNCAENSRWNFISALLFTITVISSIGYGFISPVTWEGQIVCICYAVIGIPIFLLCLANLSGFLGGIFTYVYIQLDSINPVKRFMLKRKIKKRLERKMKKKQSVNSKRSLNLENQNHVTSADDGGGFAVFAANRFMNDSSLGRSETLFNKDLDDLSFDLDSNESDEDDEDDDDMYDKTNEVPIVIALFVIFVYILGGAYIFKQFENWSLIKSVYFVFVTLSTMGFGDLVPGQGENEKHPEAKLLTVVFYSLFGMSIIGMCFSVMQGVAKRNILKLVKLIKNLFQFKKAKKEPLVQAEKETIEILNRIRKLQEYENRFSAKKRKQHVLN